MDTIEDMGALEAFDFDPLHSVRDDSITWALFEGAPLNITQVQDPHRRALTCMGCGQPLTARMGSIKRWHYSHRDANVDCAFYSAETKDHFNTKLSLASELSKNIGAKLTIMVACRSPTKINHSGPITKTWDVAWDSVAVEVQLEGIRPDIVLFHKGRPVTAIEVAVTSPVSPKKAELLAELEIPWIEISAGTNLDLDPKGIRKPEDERTWKWSLDKPIPVRRVGPKALGCPVCTAYGGWKQRTTPEQWRDWLALVEQAQEAGRLRRVWKQDLHFGGDGLADRTTSLFICDMTDAEGFLMRRWLCVADERCIMISNGCKNLVGDIQDVRRRFVEARTQLIEKLQDCVDVVVGAWEELADPAPIRVAQELAAASK